MSTPKKAAISLIAAVALLLPLAPTAHADVQYTEIPRTSMSVVSASSEEPEEKPNGAKELSLDGDNATFWHSRWSSDPDSKHDLVYRLGDAPVKLAKVQLISRQSSNASGRVQGYSIQVGTSDTCDAGTVFTEVAAGTVPVDERDTAIAFGPASAQCVRVAYLSTWGGDNASTDAASLAEFRAWTGTESGTPGTTPPTEITVPEDTVTLGEATSLQVRLHPAFPQIVDYRFAGSQVAGRLGAALTSILINEQAEPVTVAAPAVSGNTATYKLTFANLAKVTMDAVISVDKETVTFRLANIVDPDAQVLRIRIPDHDIVTLRASDPGAQVSAAALRVDRAGTGDTFEPLSTTSAYSAPKRSHMLVANTSSLAFAFESNSTEDNTATGVTTGRVAGGNDRFERIVSGTGDAKQARVWANTWTYRGQAAKTYAMPVTAADEPWVKIKVTADANSDGRVDWQDGVVAFRDIRIVANGAAQVKNTVVARIPFNIVSQATHPFLRTLDETKRIALATDSLRQRVLLKGYEAEGHDSAHPDYADNYNLRAGGFADLKTLVDEGANWNAAFGVHVNATESYSEAKAFSEQLIKMPPKAAWGWMNQAYAIDGPKDLATQEVLKRFKKFYDQVPANLRWLYIDVYYPSGWEAERLGRGLQEQGWTVGSEWSDKFPDFNVWSHWSQEEAYGGTTNKGINSQIIRFADNADRDIWNPHPILSNSNIQEFEGWVGRNDYTAFIDNVWQRNLPTKFLQQSNIMKWEANKITFANGTVATSPLASISGTAIPTDRTMVFDGATVYDQGRYLLPWRDNGTTDGADRLYHYNPAGGSSTWTLTDSWKTQSKLTLFKLTDTGRVKVADLTPAGGNITIDTEAKTAYVLYPADSVPAAASPAWGQASMLKDPSFYSGTLDAYTADNATIEKSARGNLHAVLGSGTASIAQRLNGGNLPAGTYSAWAQIEVQPGKSRTVTVSATGAGVTPVAHQRTISGGVGTAITSSTAINATASDELFRTYHQRVRVAFATTGGPVTLGVAAGAGDAVVRVDDLRVVAYTPPSDTASTPSTVFFEDFENIDTGYWPFVTGSAQSGDARTQLAKKHAPYSQAGWWGRDLSGNPVEGGKLLDNVLDGTWSLMAHEENGGQILRTTHGSVPFEPGRKYRVSMLYQAGFANTYDLEIGYDTPTGAKAMSTSVKKVAFEQARGLRGKINNATLTTEFQTGTCGTYWMGINKTGSGYQADLVIDNLRVEDLGAADDQQACASGAIDVGDGLAENTANKVTTSVTSQETSGVTGLVQTLSGPSGWIVERSDAGPGTLAPNATATASWTVTPPLDATDGTLVLKASYRVDGEDRSVQATRKVQVQRTLRNGINYLSDLPFASEANGWGPIERDMSNGEQGRGDGSPLSLRGTKYAKGLGTHATSSVTFDLAGKCTAFSSVLGIDDAQGTKGSATFTVLGDGAVLHGPTAVLTGASAPVSIADLDVRGVKTLELKVDDGGNGNGNDHADWADAKVTCAIGTGPTPTPDPTPKVPTLAAPSTARVGATFAVSVAGFAANDRVRIELHSAPVALGTLTTDANGAGTLTATVPEVAAGQHSIVAIGTGARAQSPIRIAARSARPLPATGGAGMAAPVAGLLCTVAIGGTLIRRKR